MAAGDDAQRKSWTPRDYILAALGGCVAATAIVIVVSVVLSPGQIIFSITHASHDDIKDGGMNLKLTIFVNNTSHRAKVKLLSLFVVLTNSTSSMGKYTTDIHVDAPTFPFPADGYLSDQGSINVDASQHLLGDLASSFTGQRLESGGLTVVLTSEVRFQIGLARTKIYDIRVSCPGVTFVQEGRKSQAKQSFVCAG